MQLDGFNSEKIPVPSSHIPQNAQTYIIRLEENHLTNLDVYEG